MSNDRANLATLVRAHAEALEPWESAELHLLEQAFRERLAALNVAVTPDVAVTLMATATLLANHVPEFGGDARCALGEVAQLGLRLLEEPETGPPRD